MANLLHLETFLEVVRLGSFANAARSLRYTPSAVSQQISALERELQVQLFERLPQGILPTAASRVLAERGVDVLERLSTLRRDLAEVGRGEKGEMHLGSFASAATRLVAPALVDLRCKHPSAEISMTEGEPDELLPLLVSGELDALIAYAYRLSPRRWPHGLVADELMTEGFLLLVSTQHPLADRKRVRLEAFADDVWVSIRSGTQGDRYMIGVCAAAGFEPRIAYRCNNFEVIRELVKANVGVSLVSSLGYRPDADLRALHVVGSTRQREVVLLRRSSSHNPIVDAMMISLESVARRQVFR